MPSIDLLKRNVSGTTLARAPWTKREACSGVDSIGELVGGHAQGRGESIVCVSSPSKACARRSFPSVLQSKKFVPSHKNKKKSAKLVRFLPLLFRRILCNVRCKESQVWVTHRGAKRQGGKRSSCSSLAGFFYSASSPRCITP